MSTLSKGSPMNPRAEPPVRSIGTDAAAFTQFYRAHADDVTRFVARRVADPHRVADLTAQVFVAVIDAAPRCRGSSARACSTRYARPGSLC